MQEIIGSWITAVLGWFAQIPQPAWAVFLGVIIGASGTQWIKRTFPMRLFFKNETQDMYVFRIRLLALVLSLVPTYYLWPHEGPLRSYRLMVAVLVGFATPALYKAFTHFLYKRWPDLEDKLSGTNE